MLEENIKKSIRDIPDFPKAGIIFKDITPILKDQALCTQIVDEFIAKLDDLQFDVIAGIESRGFLFGLMLANKLNKPFIPIRKMGKLPHKTIQQSYDLEYGSAVIEVHEDAFEPGARVLIHDDLLATGGTVAATSLLIEKMQGVVVGFSFIVSLDFLGGEEKLKNFSENVYTLARY